MPARIHPQRPARRPRARVLAAAALVGGVLIAGCGAGTRTKSSESTAAGVARSGPLAYANCMRSNGVPNFPDPTPGGRIRFGNGVVPSTPAFQAAQSKCAKLMGNGVGGPFTPGATTHPSTHTLANLRKIAVCMRAHGISEFPDPSTTVPSRPAASGAGVITDYDGAILVLPSTLNMQAPAYRHALAACGAPPLGLPH